MTSPPEEHSAPTSTSAPTPPKPPRRKRSDGTGKLDTSAKPDVAKPNTRAGVSTKVDDTIASTTDAPAPPKRGRRSAGGASSAVTAAAASAAASPVTKPAPAKAAPPPVTARKPTRAPTPPPVTAVPTIATAEADADAVLVDETPPPPRRDTGLTGVSTGTPTVVGTGRTAAVRAERLTRQTITKVDLWSVTKLSLCFYLSSMFVTVVAIVALWLIASAAGIVHSIEKFLGDLLSAKNFHFLSATVLRGAILVGLVVVALQVVLTVIGASFYNIFAELFGGVEITVRDEGPAE